MPITIDKETAFKLGLTENKPPKYHNKKTKVDGKIFDSVKEANRYSELMLLNKLGIISELKMQVPFTLIPTIKDENGNVLERAVLYKADFVYKKVIKRLLKT